MKVWKCLFTGKTMFGDGYKFREIHEGCVMEVKSKLITRGGEQVIALIDQWELKQVEMD
jgi:hypothetical protein